MTTNVGIHFSSSPQDFAPKVNVHKIGQDYSFALNFDKAMFTTAFLAHEQMVILRNVLTKAIAESPLKCINPECEEVAIATCENSYCGNARFCDDHGQKGGDREGGTNPNGSPYGAHSVPSICDPCIERSRA